MKKIEFKNLKKIDLKDPKKYRLAVYAFVTVLFVAGMLISRNSKNSTDDYLAFSNDGYFTVTDNNGLSRQISYSEVTFLEYCSGDTLQDLGEATTGTTESHMRSGKWECEAYGEYTAILNDKLSSYIVIKTDTDTYLINFESDKNTEALFEALQKAVDEAK